MPLPLNAELVQSLVRSQFGSVDSFIVHWEERVATGSQRKGQARDRSTVYRWLDLGIPAKEEDIFGFAAALDVDPIVLLPLGDPDFRSRFAQERRFFQVGLQNLSQFSVFWSIYKPGPGWPSKSVSQTFYDRNWFVQDFDHKPAISEANIYAGIEVIAPELNATGPRTYHIGYRRSGAADEMWRPYGTLLGVDGLIQLISESGDYQKASFLDSPRVIHFETYFGPGPVEFRICSLHRFNLRISAPSSLKNTVRFVA
ncbi:MAG: hypothetical protein AAFQ32_18250 [Pseudomonadota bacterium]